MEIKQDYAVTLQNSGYLAPAASVHEALVRYQMMKDFIHSILKPGVDYGSIPGSDKPALWKPGAEKLATFFGLRPVFQIVEKVTDWTGTDHGGEPFFILHYKCQLYRNGELIGEGLGSCNSWEAKYRYRSQNRKCPKCGKETIIKGKAEYGGGWLCHTKKGGCGAKFADNDSSITNQETGRVKNTDVFDQVNTIDKMAQKRAMVAAVLVAVNASDYFTQDIEDFIDGDYVESEPVATPAPTKKARPEDEPIPAPASEMTLEFAESELNSKGVRYGDLDSDKLRFMHKALSTKEPTEEIVRKITAIRTILAAREAA